MQHVDQGEKGQIVIVSLMRSMGDTGLQAHTRALHDGFIGSGLPCAIQTPFSASKVWWPVFALRPLLISRISKNWSTRWYRHWHFIALRAALTKFLGRRPVTALLAQCPLSAQACLNVRDVLGLDVPIVLVCHFNVSQAEEFREKGELTDRTTYQRIADLEARVIHSVDRVIYVSHWARQVIEGSRGLRPRSSVVIWNGIPAEAPSSGLLRNHLGLTEKDLVLVNVGTLEPRKNQVLLIDLFAEIRQSYAEAKLILVGEGPDRGKITKKVNQLKLAGSVQLIGRRRDAAELLGLADVYVHYARLENMPIVLLESARAGIPSAAIPVGGIPEIQHELGGSVALRPDDTKASLEQLRPLLEDSSLRRAMGLRAQQNFKRQFTQEIMVRAYLEAIGREPADRVLFSG